MTGKSWKIDPGGNTINYQSTDKFLAGSGTVGFEVTGSGTLVMDEAASGLYTGTTTVSGGTLKLETVNDLTLKKPADVSSSVGCECHSSLIAANTFGSHATACCEPCPNSSAPFPTVTLAAKVESMNGTIPIITVPRRILFLYRPEPPKPDVTLPLSGEFNPPAIVESFQSKISPFGLRTNGVRILIPAQANKQTAVKLGWLNQRFIGMSPFLKSKVIPKGEILVFVTFLGAP